MPKHGQFHGKLTEKLEKSRVSPIKKGDVCICLIANLQINTRTILFVASKLLEKGIPEILEDYHLGVSIVDELGELG